MPKTFWITPGAKTALMAARSQLGPKVVSPQSLRRHETLESEPRSQPKGVFTMLTPFNQVGSVT